MSSKKIEIKALENGPNLVNAQATFTDLEGNTHPIEGKMVALCRCGQSENKPFCDGTHKKINFKAPAVTITLSVE
ncbi:MAG: CDGSH iron-sulfur domain-containing protein [Anaerolineales bacterium]